MSNIFILPAFEFPYDYKFPGQGTNERILFITRENPVMLLVRRVGVVAAALTVFLAGYFGAYLLGSFVNPALASLLMVVAVILAIVFAVVGWWWVTTLWTKSLMIITTQRLTKYIYTTPFNRHILSLPLDMIVDTGSYTKGFIQALFKLGTFTARSSATSSGSSTDDEGRINKKYFYIENVAASEDLQHYVNKLLYAFRHHHEYLGTFRPFIPQLKGSARQQFMEKYPDFWS
jgi:hypothetical protein